VIFVDTNVFMYAVGGPHPLRDPARDFLLGVFEEDRVLVTSAEVMQELLHAYLAVSRSASGRGSTHRARYASITTRR
jgi:predicted nucleic acid-binding protein